MNHSEERRLQRAKNRWLKKYPGEIYKGPYFSRESAEKRSLALKGIKPTEITREKQRASARGGIDDKNCPVVLPGSRTEQVIIGSLLGDGYFSTAQGFFGERHSQDHKEITMELARIIGPFINFKENSQEQWNKSKNRGPVLGVYTRPSPKYPERTQYTLRTPVLPTFKILRQLWYPEGKKMVPDEVLDKVGPQALAWWYMGDGSYKVSHRSINFATMGFTNEDVNKLISVLNKFNLTRVRCTGRNNISLSVEDSQKILPIIAEYIVPTLRYKLGPLEPTYKPYNPHHYDPEPIITERMLAEMETK